MHVYTVMDRWS